MDFRHTIEVTGEIVDIAGVAVMVIGALVSIPFALRGYQPRKLPAGAPKMGVYRAYRQLLGGPSCWGLSCWWRPTSSGRSRSLLPSKASGSWR